MMALIRICDVCAAQSEPEMLDGCDFAEAILILTIVDQPETGDWRRRGVRLLCPACARIERSAGLVPPATISETSR